MGREIGGPETMLGALARAHALLSKDPMWMKVVRVEVRENGDCTHYYDREPQVPVSEQAYRIYRRLAEHDEGLAEP